MSWELRFSNELEAHINADLDRPHDVAFERVGFIACRVGLGRNTQALLAYDYMPVDDACYLPSREMGALIDAEAIRAAMQRAFRDKCAIVHVHRHDHPGLPHFSGIDEAENSKLIPTFWNVSPRMPHGALVLSFDRAHGKVWNKTGRSPAILARITSVGSHLKELS